MHSTVKPAFATTKAQVAAGDLSINCVACALRENNQ